MKKWQHVMFVIMIILVAGCALIDRESMEEKNGHKSQTEQEEEAGEDREEEELEEEAIDQRLLLPADYFNVVKEVDGKQVIQNVENIFILVNKELNLPADYVPVDLVRPNVRFVFGDEDVEKAYLRKEAAEALEKMFQKAEEEGIYLFASSGYRSYERQETIFLAKAAEVGEENALAVVAYPGQSEHQTGLAMDITAASNNFQLTEDFADTPEGQWLAENAHRFGFILRYPKGKEAITGYSYEPWHFRYVGEEIAQIIYEKNWTLEEFFQEARSL